MSSSNTTSHGRQYSHVLATAVYNNLTGELTSTQIQPVQKWDHSTLYPTTGPTIQLRRIPYEEMTNQLATILTQEYPGAIFDREDCLRGLKAITLSCKAENTHPTSVVIANDRLRIDVKKVAIANITCTVTVGSQEEVVQTTHTRSDPMVWPPGKLPIVIPVFELNRARSLKGQTFCPPGGKEYLSAAECIKHFSGEVASWATNPHRAGAISVPYTSKGDTRRGNGTEYRIAIGCEGAEGEPKVSLINTLLSV